MEGEETFEPSLLGYADEVVEERISDDDVVLIKGAKTTSAVSDFVQAQAVWKLLVKPNLIKLLIL